MSVERPDATALDLVLRVDTRSQGVPQTETDQQDDRSKLISKLVPVILSDLDKDNLISGIAGKSIERAHCLCSKGENSFTKEY